MTKVPASRCVSCGQINTESSAFCAPTPDPHPGDTALCLYCGHVSIVADDLTLRALTDAEMHEIAGDESLLAAQRMRVKILESIKQKQKERGSDDTQGSETTH